MIIAASSQLAAEAGARVADGGGNAVDAVVAASLLSMATDVGMVDPSAGALCTLWPPGEAPLVIDGFAEVPGRGLPPTSVPHLGCELRMDYGGGVLTYVGPESVATPGALAGLARASRGWGRSAWSDLIAPATQALAAGFPLSEPSFHYLGYARDPLYGRSTEGHALLHGDGGRPLRPGEIVHNDALAATYERLARDGVETLYGGALGRELVAELERSGGARLGLRDLREYEALVGGTLEVEASGWSVATVPLPALGGVALAALVLLGRDLAGQPGRADRIAAAQRAVLEFRHGTLERAVDPEGAAARLLAAARLPGERGLPGLSSPSTTHASAVDTDGLACSITISSGYGSGVVIPGTGMWLNNMLGEVELLPPGAAPLVAGTRLRSNMAPTVARREDGALLALGSPGSSRITTALSQVLGYFLSGECDLEEAVRHPRLHAERCGDELRVACEPGLDLRDPGLDLRPFDAPHMYFGGVQAALLTADGRLEAAADPRREGAVARGGG